MAWGPAVELYICVPSNSRPDNLSAEQFRRRTIRVPFNSSTEHLECRTIPALDNLSVAQFERLTIWPPTNLNTEQFDRHKFQRWTIWALVNMLGSNCPALKMFDAQIVRRTVWAPNNLIDKQFERRMYNNHLLLIANPPTFR